MESCAQHEGHVARIQSLEDWRVQHEQANADSRERISDSINESKKEFAALVREVNDRVDRCVPVWLMWIVTGLTSVAVALVSALISVLR